MKRKLLWVLLGLIACLSATFMASCDVFVSGDVAHEVPVCSHTYGEWVNGSKPTCTSIGYKHRTCKTCKNVEYEFIKATGHAYSTEPVVLEQGAKLVNIYICASCGSSKMETVKGYSEGLLYGLIDGNEHYRVEGMGTCVDTEVIIPKKYEGKPVTEIGEKAFFESETLISVKIPETIVRIGDKAFSKCEKLEKVDMTDKVEIGVDVFRGSINVDITVVHELKHVAAKEATCSEAGNVEHYYCEICDEYYKDTEGKERLYEVTIAPAHTFADGKCTLCGAVKAEFNITYVSTIGHLGKFALGTLESAIGLPTAINVKTEDGRTHTLPIDWDMSGYVKNKAGEYTIEGYIQIGLFHMSADLTNRVEAKVEIVESMKGTADVVFILDVSGSMSDEINNVKDNIKAFAQALEDKGVSARWSAITYSDFTHSSSSAEKTKIIMNGAEQWFVSAEEYKTAINGINLANGGDDPEVAIDGLMMATTLSTRADARVFYILLTDANYKNNNNFGVSNMSGAVNKLDAKGVNVSVITTSSYKSSYKSLYETTGGIYSDIRGSFSDDLLNSLVPIIYEEVMD